MKVFFQGIGTLFQYNLGLPSQLVSFEDVKVTIGTRHLLLYVYGIWYVRRSKNLKMVLTTFPTFPPNYQTMVFGSWIAHFISRSSLYKKFLSVFDIVHLNDRQYPYTKAALRNKKETVLTLHWLPSKVDAKSICGQNSERGSRLDAQGNISRGRHVSFQYTTPEKASKKILRFADVFKNSVLEWTT